MSRSTADVTYAHRVDFSSPILSVRREHDRILVYTAESAYWITGASGAIEISGGQLLIEDLAPTSLVQPAITYSSPPPHITHR